MENEYPGGQAVERARAYLPASLIRNSDEIIF